jgi:TPR repeat protein
MKTISKVLIAVPLCVALWSFARPARAGDIEDAMEAYENGRYALAVELLQIAGRAGNAQAQEILAFMYTHGSGMYPGVARDMRTAAHWFDLAARNGRPVSRYMACAIRRDALSADPREPSCVERVARVDVRGLQ